MTTTLEATIGSLAVLGAGKMGSTLISALIASGTVTAEKVIATAKRREHVERLAADHGIHATLDNRAAVSDAEVVLLCVKPQVAPIVLAELRGVLKSDQLVLSIIAGMTTVDIEKGLEEGIPVVRAMPNTPARIGRGMTAVCGGRWATRQQLELAAAIFSRLGRCLILEEKYFNAVTGLSGSGPAFIYMVIEALAEGGVKVGLPRQVATELAAQTCLGAAHMVLETGDHPALLKDEVTTPAGCTIDGILKLEEGGLRVTLIKAIVEARQRAAELLEDS